MANANETSPADDTRAWSAFHDEDCAQWQVHDGSTVLATGIESELVARKMAAAPDLRQASKELYGRLQDYLDVSDQQLIEQGHDGLVKAMDAMEAAWHKADGTVPETNWFLPSSPTEDADQ